MPVDSGPNRSSSLTRATLTAESVACDPYDIYLHLYIIIVYFGRFLIVENLFLDSGA